jgi:sarcosine/dimethylglycine N-methyltransferase
MSVEPHENAIAAQREDYRKLYDTGLAKLLSKIWGGSLHMGLFADAGEPLAAAQQRVKDRMAHDAALRPGKQVIEAACGVGTTAIHLARRYGVTVHATNISEVQLAEARQAAAREGLSERVTFGFADYHALDAADHAFDCWWCQEALLYAIDKRRVLEEARRVVRPQGRIVFTDLLITRAMPESERLAFTADLKAPEMWAIEDWDRLLADMGFAVIERHDWQKHTVTTFENVQRALADVRDEYVGLIGAPAVEATEHRVGLQLDKARAGQLGWCFYALAA